MTRLVWLFGIISLIGVTSGFERALAQSPQPSAYYAGMLTPCNTGTFTLGSDFSVLTAGTGSRITNLHVTGVSITSVLPGALDLDIPVDIPVAADGSFIADFSPLSLTSGPIVVTSHLEGRFQGTSLSGSFSVTINGSSCDGTFQAQLTQPPPPPTPAPPQEQTFSANIPLVNGCGGGALSITRSAGLLSITKVTVEGFVANGRTFSGAGTFAQGTVPIDPNTGAFGWVYFPGQGPGQEIALTGTFFQVSVEGLVTVSPSTCSPVGFNAYSFTVGTFLGGPGLPSTGSGPSSKSRAGLALELGAAALGLVALGAGLALRQRYR